MIDLLNVQRNRFVIFIDYECTRTGCSVLDVVFWLGGYPMCIPMVVYSDDDDYPLSQFQQKKTDTEWSTGKKLNEVAPGEVKESVG